MSPPALYSRDASLFAHSSVRVAAAMPAAGPRVDARRGACVDTARPRRAASRLAPPQRTRPRNRYCRDRNRCRCSPAPRSRGTHTAGSSSPAPHATFHKTLDKFVRRAHNRQADPPTRHRTEGPGADREIFTRAFTSFALRNSIANIANPSRRTSRARSAIQYFNREILRKPASGQLANAP
jgi:hypothetical protein